MNAMDITDPTSPRGAVDADVLGEVATLVRNAASQANEAAGQDLRSPWLDVLAETVTAAGYLTDRPDRAAVLNLADDGPAHAHQAGSRALAALERAAHVLDSAPTHSHDAILVRAALTDAIRLARRIQR